MYNTKVLIPIIRIVFKVLNVYIILIGIVTMIMTYTNITLSIETKILREVVVSTLLILTQYLYFMIMGNK